jgi:hypothetical protein
VRPFADVPVLHGFDHWAGARIAAEERGLRNHQLMMIGESEARLASMLAEAGVTPGAVTVVDVRATVGAFRRFASITVDDSAQAHEDGDGVLAQFGTYDFRGVREFSADLTRQYLESGGQDAPLWQLGCTIYWDPSPENSALASGHLWSFGMDLDDFFAEAVTLPGWAWALGGSQAPRDLVITFDEV